MSIFSALANLFHSHEDSDEDHSVRPENTSDEVNLTDLMGGAIGSGPVPDAAKSLPETGDTTPEIPDELRHCMLMELMSKHPDRFYFKDLESRFLLVSASLTKKYFLKADIQNVIGRTDFDFFSQEHARQTFQDERDIVRTGKPLIDCREKETWPDGHISWALTSKFPLRDKNGTIVGTWGFSRDITEQKRTEDELRQSEEQLRQSQKMEAFGQLAGGIAHDFNNMLVVISGAAQLLEMEMRKTAPQIKRNLDMIIDTTKIASDLTSQLLTFSRKEKKQVVRIDFHAVIKSVVNLLSHTISRTIKIVERVNPLSGMVMGDFVQLQNVLLNLSINARDAMPDGGTLTFTTDIVGPAGNVPSKKLEIQSDSYLRVRVIDTGTGMDEKTKLRAFEPFFTTKPHGKGTGLGLSSVFGTIKNHNGLVEIDSEPGKGTTFTIFLPLIPESAEQPDELPQPAGDGKTRIMVIDEDKHTRDVLSDMLKQLGYSMIICKDGAEAVEYYRKSFCDIALILIDSVLPHMGGSRCVQALRKINPNAKVLIASGYNLISDTQQLIVGGISGLIQKPYRIEELSQGITRALESETGPG